MARTDPPAAGDPRNTLDVALGAVSRRWGVTQTDALHLVLAWATHREMTVGDVDDLVVVESHVVAHHRR